MRSLAARANALEPALDDTFQPTDTHRTIAGALAHSTSETLHELAEAAGVSRSTVSRALSDPSALRWIVAQGTHLAASSLGTVHAVLLQRALSSKNPTWLKLYLSRFDPEFQKQEMATKGRNTQINLFQQMSDEELGAFIKREARKAGASHPGDPPPQVPRDS